jgi:hypothetical protein
MVCATATMGATAAGPKLAGGFVQLGVGDLEAAWGAYVDGELTFGDIRVWLAAREVVARRCTVDIPEDFLADPAEVARLTGLSTRSVREAFRGLAMANLGPGAPPGQHGPAAGPMADSIGGGRGCVAVPRRLLRFLCRSTSPAIVAVCLGTLLRCVSRRKDWDGRGRVKASWISMAFGLSIRQVRAARAELVALGWMAPEPSDQIAMNRWGKPYIVNLEWVQPAPQPHPPLPRIGAAASPPLVDQEPLSGLKNQEPAGGLAGFWTGGLDGEGGAEASKGAAPTSPVTPPARPTPPSIQTPTTVGSAPAPKAAPVATASLPPARLRDVRIEDLRDTERLLDLHRQAVAEGLVGDGEAGRLRIVAAAERALAIARNPTALFAWLVINGCWRYLTGADEDRGNARIKVFLRGPEPSRDGGSWPLLGSGEMGRGGIGLSEDARIVKAIREATIRAGIYRDPFPAFRSRYPEWTKERWDAAMRELGLS